MPSMSLQAIDFDNPAVANAINPSAHGYHHGPIPNNNAGYVDPARAAAIAAGNRPYPNVTPIQNNAAPAAGVTMSALNTGVCDIDVNGGQMCGQVFANQPSKLRHIRNEHTGALLNPTTVNITQAVRIAGENSIKLFVLSGGWRDARYITEPGTGPAGGYLDTYATACERIARADPVFAAQFGTHFHRRPAEGLTPNSKRKRGPEPPPFPDDDDDDDSPPTPSAGRGSGKGRKRKTPTKKRAPPKRASARLQNVVDE